MFRWFRRVLVEWGSWDFQVSGQSLQAKEPSEEPKLASMMLNGAYGQGKG